MAMSIEYMSEICSPPPAANGVVFISEKFSSRTKTKIGKSSLSFKSTKIGYIYMLLCLCVTSEETQYTISIRVGFHVIYILTWNFDKNFSSLIPEQNLIVRGRYQLFVHFVVRTTPCSDFYKLFMFIFNLTGIIFKVLDFWNCYFKLLIFQLILTSSQK